MKNRLLEITIITTFVIIPFSATTIEFILYESDVSIYSLLFKWFVFSGIGLRLFTAGMKQVISPSLTAKQIFKFKNNESFPVIREVGFGNLSIGLIGIVSLCMPDFRLASAVSGSLYFTLAGCMHLLKKRESKGGC